MYTKVFRSIFDGSLYGHFEATVTFLAMLVLADKDGEVDQTPAKIAANTGFPLDLVQKGISELQEPDERSRTPDEDGRRIVLLDAHRDWGWRITNFEKYNSIRNQQERAEYFRQYRKRKRQELRATDATSGNQRQPAKTPPDSYTDTSTDSEKSKSAATLRKQFSEIQTQYPKRAGDQRWRDAEKHYHARLREGVAHEDILAGVLRYSEFCHSTDKTGTEFVKQAASFLGTERAFLLPWSKPPNKAQVQQDKTVDAGLEWLHRAD